MTVPIVLLSIVPIVKCVGESFPCFFVHSVVDFRFLGGISVISGQLPVISFISESSIRANPFFPIHRDGSKNPQNLCNLWTKTI